MKNYYSLKQVNPLVLFWLGVLTGAVVVGLIFFYKVLSPGQYQGAFYKYNYDVKTYDSYDPYSGVYDSYKLNSDTLAAPDPTGGKTIYEAPDPTGG